jgi:hypothetical protein
MQTIDVALVTQFSDMVHIQAQQNKARLRPYCTMKQIKGDKFAYDGLGVVEAREVIGRNQQVQFADIDHKRRKIARRRFELTLPIDASDVRGALISPDSLYAAASAKAMERVFDRVVIEALFATVYTGRDFETAVTFASDGGFTVTATGGLTYAKLLEIHKNFMDAEVGNETPEKLAMSITGDEHSALMQENELVNRDFSQQYAVDGGRIVKANGIDLIPFAGGVARPLLDVSAGVRSCFALAENAVAVGVSKEMGVTVKDRADLVETSQVQIIFELGAVRTEGVRVQKVTTTDA